MSATVTAGQRTTITSRARTLLRDTGRAFQTEFVTDGTPRALPLPGVAIVPSSCTVRLDGNPIETLDETADYTIDSDNGYLNFVNVPPSGRTVWVQGLLYEWFSDAQLSAYTDIVVDYYAHSEGDRLSVLAADGAVVNIMAKAVLVEALWALLTEISRDIDIRSSETDIPANERYRQVFQMLQDWVERLRGEEAMLNIGIYKIEIFNLRRVSMTTGRLVPIYVEQEFDDLTFPPTRVLPPIDTGGPVS